MKHINYLSAVKIQADIPLYLTSPSPFTTSPWPCLSSQIRGFSPLIYFPVKQSALFVTLHLRDKTLDRNNTRKGGFVQSRGLLHGCGGPRNLGRTSWQREHAEGKETGCSSKVREEAKRKERAERDQPKDTPLMIYLICLGPTSSHFQSLQKQCYQLGTKHLTHEPAGDIVFSNHDRHFVQNRCQQTS